MSSALSIAVNVRSLHGPMTGVQRYTSELVKRWDGLVKPIEPARSLHGLEGHLWEQFILPRKVGSRLLFSPSNTGPVAARRQVVTIHDTSSFDYPMLRNRFFGSFYRWVQPQLANRVSYVLTVSEFAKRRIVFHMGVPSTKVVVIPNGVSARFSPQALGLFDHAVASLRFPSRRYVLSVGTLEPCKNHRRLLQAWAQIQKKIDSDVWLVLAGIQGPSRIFGEEVLGPLPDRVFLAGHVGELLPAVCAGAIACAQVSIYDSFGLPAIEAMACGTPVLASSVAAIPEIVADAALLIDPFNVHCIAEGIRRLAEDDALREELKRKGLARAKYFSWDDTARRTWEVLERAAALN